MIRPPVQQPVVEAAAEAAMVLAGCHSLVLTLVNALLTLVNAFLQQAACAAAGS